VKQQERPNFGIAQQNKRRELSYPSPFGTIFKNLRVANNELTRRAGGHGVTALQLPPHDADGGRLEVREHVVHIALTEEFCQHFRED
jgi:hypothetical protein